MNFPNINQKTISFFLSVLLSIFCLGGTLGCLPAYAALDSWKPGTGSLDKIIDFVNQVNAEDRIAVFDNDGTLWAEKPIYFPIQFELQKKLQGDNFVGYTTDEYIEEAKDFVYNQNHKDFHVPYVDLVYEPVIELVNYLKNNEFKVYISSGGDIDFVRSFSDDVYGIPPEQVIGTAVKTSFDKEFGGNVKRDTDFLQGIKQEKHEDLAHYNDQEGKPVGIQNHIGKRPIIAVGNSSGDFEMFQYTDTGVGNSLIVLINHDDCEEEYEYNNVPYETKVNHDGDVVARNESLDAAQTRDNWIVVSMKEDFDHIFSQPFYRSRPYQRGCN
ncbi:hypothetical protein BJP34_09920 [Moorena producens PAL-8-15-08-1]|uniref:Haloacid dehalogenase-like hydrolase n=1 Tax=Moorena producens PAL-8-15-08-1 TaxID=1458985 RepID=A0A1D8TPY5_9CYAN|nr:HAD family hydrolase [Moorena producens]AOW99730.1 hypothetical protein BJP34_09920 [Moorena producens PAL-8-15-08-1]